MQKEKTVITEKETKKSKYHRESNIVAQVVQVVRQTSEKGKKCMFAQVRNVLSKAKAAELDKALQSARRQGLLSYTQKDGWKVVEQRVAEVAAQQRAERSGSIDKSTDAQPEPQAEVN